MKLNVGKTPKKLLEWYQQHKCKHGQIYLVHQNCIFTERPLGEKCRIGILDIESGASFDGDYGYAFSYCIKYHGENNIIKNVVTPREIRRGMFDKRLIKDFCSDVKKFDKLVVWWGKDSGYRQRHDIPFMRTRAVENGYGSIFPQHKELKIVDLYDVARGKFRLHSNSLFSVCKFLGVKSKGSPIVPYIWRTALAGDKASLDYILKHNVEDVISTDLVFDIIYEFKPCESNI